MRQKLHGCTTDSFVDGKRLTNLRVAYHPSALSSALLSIYRSSRSSEEWHIAIARESLKMCAVNSCFQLV
jgi:hypothetical protein